MRGDLTNASGVDLTARQRNLTKPARHDLTTLIKGDYRIDVRERMRAYLPSPRPWAADDSPAADQSRRSKQHVSADAKTEARGRNRKGNGTSTDVEVAECHGVSGDEREKP